MNPLALALAQDGPRSLDGSLAAQANNKPSQIKFRVTGTALGAHTYDQAGFFSQLGDIVIAATTYVLATVTPSATRFSNAQVSDFLTFNPLPLINANVTGANSADAVGSMELLPVRWTPMGTQQTDSVYASNFQTAQDFQNTRVQLPVTEIIDGYTYLRLVNLAQATAVTYSIAFTFGPTMDRRLDVPQGPAAVIRSPG